MSIPTEELVAKPKGRVNMRMIAKKAGVSATTVSLALRDDPSISKSTKDRVREIQRALGYEPLSRRPRPAGARQAELRVLTYGVVGVDLREDNYAPFLHGVSEECHRRGIKVELQCTMDRNALPTLPAGDENRGFILTGAIDDRHVAALAGRPFVVLGNYRFAEPVHMAAIDLMEAARSLLATLASEGMTHLVVVAEDFGAAFERTFLMHIRGVFLDLGYSTSDESLVEVGAGFVRTAEAADQILAIHRPGTVVLTLEKHCAQQVVLELRSKQHGPSGTIPVVSFGEASSGGRSRHFRVFDIGKELCARLAVIRLAELFCDPDTPPCVSLVRSPGWV